MAHVHRPWRSGRTDTARKAIRFRGGRIHVGTGALTQKPLELGRKRNPPAVLACGGPPASGTSLQEGIEEGPQRRSCHRRARTPAHSSPAWPPPENAARTAPSKQLPVRRRLTRSSGLHVRPFRGCRRPGAARPALPAALGSRKRITSRLRRSITPAKTIVPLPIASPGPAR